MPNLPHRGKSGLLRNHIRHCRTKRKEFLYVRKMTVPTTDEIRRTLRAAKDAAGESNSSLAKLSGVPESPVAKFFGGAAKNPSFATVAAFALALGISLDALIGREMPAQAPQEDKTGEMETLRRYCSHLEEEQRNNRALRYGQTGLNVLLALALLIYMTLDFQNPGQGMIREHSRVNPWLLGCVLGILGLLLFLSHTIAECLLRKKKGCKKL